jgi:putative Mg2+ transporter-C (MgtC) family protein
MTLIGTDTLDILLRLGAASLLGAAIGWERRAHHKAIGMAGMVLVAIGSTTYMLLATRLAEADPSSISRTLQGFLSGIGFLGGAVIFKSGFDVKGIKAAAAVWITGAMGLAIATSHWGLGLAVGAVTVTVLFVADSFPDEVREAKQEPSTRDSVDHGRG